MTDTIQYYPTYGYKKYYKDGEIDGIITGTILLTNSMPKLLVIDVDNKSKSADRLQNYQNLLATFVPKDANNIYIERTVNYGLHIILVNDLDLTNAQDKNRWCSIYNDWFYSLDIFITANTESRSGLMITKPHADGLIGLNGVKLLSRQKVTRAKTKDNQTSAMEIISKCDNFINSTMTFSQYAEWLLGYSEINISNFQQIIKSKKQIANNQQHATNILKQNTDLLERLENCIEEINISESNVQVLCDCIIGITIHNYSGTDIKTEFSLLPYFRSILALSQWQANQIAKYVFEHGKLTENAKQNYYSTYERVKKTQQPFKDLSILITMIKYNNPDKYSEYKTQLQNLIEKYQHNVPSYIKDRTNHIDFRTPVSYTDVFNQNNIQQYIAVEDWFTQVQQVLIYNTADNCYYRKYKIKFGKQCMVLQQISLQDIKDVLASIKINNIKLYDYLIDHRQYIQYDDIEILSDNPKVFSRFCGYCYSAVQNDEIIKPYLNHIKEIIANNDEKVYNYIINWLAHLIQKPSQKLGTALVIIGGQGTGKNTFTTPIVNLLGYYADEINDINCVVGNFNPMLEGKHLLVCNEITQQYDTAANKANFDKMKSLITDCCLQINQKNEKVRTVENIANFIMLSNHNKPIVLEQDDRRYCVCRTAPKRDLPYYQQLQDLYKKQEFYEALLHYLQNLDITAFYPQNIPMTEDKQRILKMSESPLYQFVVKSQIRRSNINFLFENYKKYMKIFYNSDVSTKKNEFRNNCMVYYNSCKSDSVRYYQLKQQYIVPYDDFYDDDDDFVEYIQSVDVGEKFQQFNQHIPTLINQLKSLIEK